MTQTQINKLGNFKISIPNLSSKMKQIHGIDRSIKRGLVVKPPPRALKRLAKKGQGKKVYADKTFSFTTDKLMSASLCTMSRCSPRKMRVAPPPPAVLPFHQMSRQPPPSTSTRRAGGQTEFNDFGKRLAVGEIQGRDER